MNARSKTQRHGKRTQFCDRMKLHLRTVDVCDATFRIVTLRPHTEVAFSTNYFHDTWHILSDRHGAQLLARLMWGLSFQRKVGTAVLIHGEHIKPTPFDADPSDPILLMLADGTKNDQKVLRSLHQWLNRLGPSQRTVRWHTFGLDLAIQRETAKQPRDWTQEYRDHEWMYYNDNKALWDAEQMFRRGGFICYCAPPQVMRKRALVISQMNPADYGMDYYYLADNNADYGADGEVQIFSDYNERRSASDIARRQVMHEGRFFGDRESWYAVVAARREEILRQRHLAQRTRRSNAAASS